MDPGEIGPTPPGIPEPARGREATGESWPGEDDAPLEGLLARVFGEVPDLIMMLQVADEGRLRCQTALSSLPTAPTLSLLAERAIEEIFPADLLERFAERYEEASIQRTSIRYDERIVRVDADVLLEAVLTPVFDESGVCSHLFWSARNVTQERTIRTALQKSEERFSALFDAAADGIAWMDLEGGFLEVNQALCRMLGTSASRLLSTSVQQLAHPEERESIDRLIRDVSTGETAEAAIETRFMHHRGHGVWVRANVAAVKDAEGRPYRSIWQLHDLSERRGFEERLAHQALHDPLTGLPNRSLFLDRLGRALARLNRNPSLVAVMVIDLDRFDAINDRYGHEVGDRLLIRLGEVLGASIRQADSVCRLSDDDFALLFEEVASERDVRPLADRVRQLVEAPLDIDGTEIRMGVSIGVALTESAGDRPEAILRDAGMAVDQAKAAGRGRTQVFDETMRAEFALRLKTESDLRRAIDEGQFRVFYQPQVSLKSGTIVGAEVLVRWEHPERGLVTPSEFLDLAEETGLIVPMGTWVIEQACRQLERWRTQLAGDGLMMWINMSPRQLAQSDLSEVVSKVLADTQVDPANICFEVTESAIMEETATAMSAMRSLKDLGVKVGIDDFGRGFSSLAYLKRLPLDMLKLDQTFVRGLGQSEEDSAIAAAVINLARAMGLTPIAEGVETPRQLAVLRELGCELAQGYFFASPQPAEVVTELLSQNLRW